MILAFIFFLFIIICVGILAFALVSGIVVIGTCVAVTEAAKHIDQNVSRSISKSIKNNGGKIDGAKMQFGKDCEVSIEGPDTSFSKWCKYMVTGEKEYSTKIKIKGKEIGKFNTNGNNSASFKLDENEIKRQMDKFVKKLK